MDQAAPGSLTVAQYQGVAPPGKEGLVLKLKQHPEISNPFALAWWLHKHGRRPGGKREDAAAAEDAEIAAALLATAGGLPEICHAAARGDYWAQAALLADGALGLQAGSY